MYSANIKEKVVLSRCYGQEIKEKKSTITHFEATCQQLQGIINEKESQQRELESKSALALDSNKAAHDNMIYSEL